MNITTRDCKWLMPIKSNPHAKLRLICFAYAGASASVYANWLNIPVENIEIIAIQLPGRGSRMVEPLLTEMDSIVSSLYPELTRILDLPYVIFGHSLGTKIAHASLLKIIENKRRLPEQVIISASAAPHLKTKEPFVYKENDSSFIQRLRSMGGTPEELLNNDEIMNLLLPILRADFQLSELYCAPTPSVKINCDCTLWAGSEDESVSVNDVMSWSEHFNGLANLTEFDGGHMFLDSDSSTVIQVISAVLNKVMMKLDDARLLHQVA